MKKGQKIKLRDVFWAVILVFVFYTSLHFIPFLIKTGINRADFEMPEEYIYKVKYKSENDDTQSYFYTIGKNNLIEKINKERDEMNYYTDDDWLVSEINLIN